MACLLMIESSFSGLRVAEACKELDHKVILILIEEFELWQRNQKNLGFLKQFHDVQTCEKADDWQVILDAVTKLHQKHHIDACITTAEITAEVTEYVATKLGIPASGETAVQICRDKLTCRNTLLSKGLKTVPAIAVNTLQDLDEGDFNFPAVLKPRSGGASYQAEIVPDLETAKAKLVELQREGPDSPPELLPCLARGYLLEEYIQGPLYSVEVIVNQGVASAFMVTSRVRSSLDETLEVASAMPSGLPETKERELKLYAEQVANFVGLQRGMAHIEVILRDGAPVLVEANPRLMGGPLETLYRLATGADIYQALAKTALDQPVDLTTIKPKRAMCVLGLIVVEDFEIPADFNPAKVPDQYPDLVDLTVQGPVGAVIAQDHLLSFIYVEGSSPEEAVHNGYALAKQLEIQFNTKFKL